MVTPVHRTQSRRPSHAVSLIPVFAFLVLVGGGLALAGWSQAVRERREQFEREAASAAEPTEAADPWSHLDSAGDPWEGLAPIPGPATPVAKDELDVHPRWREAQELAKLASELSAGARRAKMRGDVSRFQELGKGAKDAYSRALDLTAGWERELVVERGADGPLVSRVLGARREWNEERLFFHRTTGR